MPSRELLQHTDHGLYCAAGDFYVDPWRAVNRAVVTHAHGDHLTRGCGQYLVSAEGEVVTRARLGHEAMIQTLPFSQRLNIQGVAVSLHPAGHILGSAQVRLERAGEVVVISGDYKTRSDPTCTPFEPVKCHSFLTESTFGLPVYRWREDAVEFDAINHWWRESAAAGTVAVLLGYSLGKAQRLLAGLDPTIGPILTHGAVERLTEAYRRSGVSLPPTAYAGAMVKEHVARNSLVIAPPSVMGSTWLRRFGAVSVAMGSGWMRIRGQRRRRGLDRGFPVSDHADWPGLLAAIEATGAEEILVTHGFSATLVRHLREKGMAAEAWHTRYEGERDDDTEGPDARDTPAG